MFVILYFQVFLILTFLESREEIHDTDPYENFRNQTDKPTVTIIVPVFNEEKTVAKTINSLLQLNYPKDKLTIMVVDDGSKDNTWNFVQQFKDNPQVSLHTKQNGGKYTALNYAIENSTSTYIGCLDADSFVDGEALNHIIPYFNNENIVAVTPSLKIQNPNSILGMVQNAEYNMGIFTRKILGLLDAQYVTPGPFSIFKRDIFKTVGMYKHAHNTEDLEMALRIQTHHYKITNAHRAVVYTVGPQTLYKLYKQRVRWTGGFMQNTLDYKRMILNPQYGNLGVLILPIAMYSIVGTMVFLTYNIYTFIHNLMREIEKIKTVGYHFSFNFDLSTWDYILYNLQSTVILGTLAIGVVIFAIWYGKKLSGVKDNNSLDFVYFLLLYSLISPLWLVTSVYNTIRQRDAAWR
jgi:cellulose synthase/poly-beta-1,6-N-acetylglucosamine synthase-like glycosyltransferase